MPPFLNGMTFPTADSILKEYSKCNPLHLEIPIPFFDWENFISNCKVFFGENFFQFIIFLAGGLSDFHYNSVLEVIGMFFNLLSRIH